MTISNVSKAVVAALCLTVALTACDRNSKARKAAPVTAKAKAQTAADKSMKEATLELVKSLKWSKLQANDGSELDLIKSLDSLSSESIRAIDASIQYAKGGQVNIASNVLYSGGRKQLGVIRFEKMTAFQLSKAKLDGRKNISSELAGFQNIIQIGQSSEDYNQYAEKDMEHYVSNTVILGNCSDDKCSKLVLIVRDVQGFVNAYVFDKGVSTTDSETGTESVRYELVGSSIGADGLTTVYNAQQKLAGERTSKDNVVEKIEAPKEEQKETGIKMDETTASKG